MALAPEAHAFAMKRDRPGQPRCIQRCPGLSLGLIPRNPRRLPGRIARGVQCVSIVSLTEPHTAAGGPEHTRDPGAPTIPPRLLRGLESCKD